VAALRALAAQAEADMRALSSYFGEDVDAGRQPQICRTMREFLFMFERACAEIEEAKKKAADAERRKVRFFCLLVGGGLGRERWWSLVSTQPTRMQLGWRQRSLSCCMVLAARAVCLVFARKCPF
jgi:hypothetical protein